MAKQFETELIKLIDREADFSAFYGQSSVTEPGPTPSHWSISFHFWAHCYSLTSS